MGEIPTVQFAPGLLCKNATRGVPNWHLADGPNTVHYLTTPTCEQLLMTPGGAAEINQYTCGGGYKGEAAAAFMGRPLPAEAIAATRYTPLTTATWSSARCD